MGPFLARAGTTGDLPGALEAAGISLPEFFGARAADPVFEAACADLDTSLAALIPLRLRYAAACGDIQAAKLLSRGLGALDPGPTLPESVRIVAAIFERQPERVWDVMQDACLRAHEGGDAYPEDFHHFRPCPHCGLSMWVRLGGTYREPHIELRPPPDLRAHMSGGPPLNRR